MKGFFFYLLLRKFFLKMKSTYTVINASAGSGKTYTLVQRLLMLCLVNPSEPDAVRHIIALTFTNKAANEMKERILQWLGKFTAENYVQCQELLDIQEKFRQQGKNIPIDELHRRSQAVLDYILHHYSMLNIGTIDKFNSKLVRSFSYELGLAQNFNLEIQPEPYLIEAVDQMLDKIGGDKKVSETFIDFVNYSLDNNERVNLSQTLYQSAKEFVKDIHYKRLLENKDFDWEAYENTKNNIRKNLTEIKKDSVKITQDTITLIKERGLEIEDFSGGGRNSIAKFFYEVAKFYNKERKDFPFPSNEESALAVFEKGASSKSKQKEQDIFDILSHLMENRRNLISNYILMQKKEKILHALLPLRVNKEIQDELAKIEEENDLVLLSKFNIVINENLKNEPSAFIYEKVGTRYLHYFFDEFQDTSALQWQNFLPLRDHTISSDNTSFTLVGDPKQSIYRFRGGESQLMLNIINHKENAPVPANVISLKENYRSARNIVRFNNELYQYISELGDFEHKEIFGEKAQQEAKTNLDGRVRVNLIENAKKEDFYQDTADQMQQDIQQCLDNGFRFSDITILCRGNNDIFNYSQLLRSREVLYNGEKTFIKTISERGLTLNLSKTLNALIEFLNWTAAPKSKKFLVMLFYYLNDLGRIKIHDFSVEMLEILAIEEQKELFDFIKKRYGLDLAHSHIPNLNLYNFIEHFVYEFSAEDKEMDFILNFLEMLYGFSQNTGMTLKDFLKFWEEEGKNISIQASENIDAVQIMTIHKAKGLEFPVVFLPMENKSQDSKFTEWYDLEGENALSAVNISGFDKGLETYDEDIEIFNSENVYKNFIDRLCVQYVATTRPVEQLFLYLQKPNNSANYLEIFNFVDQYNTENVDNFDLFETNEELLRKKTKQKKKEWATMSISSIHKQGESLANIQIATPSKSYQKRKEKTRMGLLIHDILAKINHKDDMEKVLDSFFRLGTITEKEKEIITKRISPVLNDEKYAPYFSGNEKEIINEREILVTLEDGEQKFYRPDRVIKTNEGYIIVDFKTGEEEREKHQKQVTDYQNALEKTGKKVIETKLIYFDE